MILIENIRDRFPRDQLNIISSFAVLGMRPISFIDKDQLGQWGNDKLQVLLEHYGVEQTKGNVAVPPLIDIDQRRNGVRLSPWYFHVLIQETKCLSCGP